jgi:hypothetical protein
MSMVGRGLLLSCVNRGLDAPPSLSYSLCSRYSERACATIFTRLAMALLEELPATLTA